MVTKEHLENLVKDLEAQRDNAFSVAHQAIGAIALCYELLKKFEKEDIPVAETWTEQDLKDAIQRSIDEDGDKSI